MKWSYVILGNYEVLCIKSEFLLYLKIKVHSHNVLIYRNKLIIEFIVWNILIDIVRKRWPAACMKYIMGIDND